MCTNYSLCLTIIVITLHIYLPHTQTSTGIYAHVSNDHQLLVKYRCSWHNSTNCIVKLVSLIGLSTQLRMYNGAWWCFFMFVVKWWYNTYLLRRHNDMHLYITLTLTSLQLITAPSRETPNLARCSPLASPRARLPRTSASRGTTCEVVPLTASACPPANGMALHSPANVEDSRHWHCWTAHG